MMLQLFLELNLLWVLTGLSYFLVTFVRPEYSFDIVIQIGVFKDVAAQLLSQMIKVDARRSVFAIHNKSMATFKCQKICIIMFHIPPCRVPRTPGSWAICLLQRTRCKVLPALQRVDFYVLFGFVFQFGHFLAYKSNIQRTAWGNVSNHLSVQNLFRPPIPNDNVYFGRRPPTLCGPDVH